MPNDKEGFGWGETLNFVPLFPRLETQDVTPEADTCDLNQIYRITNTIPGLNVATFRLSLFNASTVVL